VEIARKIEVPPKKYLSRQNTSLQEVQMEIAQKKLGLCPTKKIFIPPKYFFHRAIRTGSANGNSTKSNGRIIMSREKNIYPATNFFTGEKI
jgi:hypothetical protein